MMTKKKTRKDKENGGKIGTPKETVKGDKDTQLHLQIDTEQRQIETGENTDRHTEEDKQKLRKIHGKTEKKYINQQINFQNQENKQKQFQNRAKKEKKKK